jgi:hypothetical protein
MTPSSAKEAKKAKEGANRRQAGAWEWIEERAALLECEAGVNR